MSSRMIFGAAMAVMSLVFATNRTHESKKKMSRRLLKSTPRTWKKLLQHPRFPDDSQDFHFRQEDNDEYLQGNLQ